MNRSPQQMELFAASQAAERLGRSDRLMDVILERENLIRAWEKPCLKDFSQIEDSGFRDTDFLISRTALVRDPYAGLCGRGGQ